MKYPLNWVTFLDIDIKGKNNSQKADFLFNFQCADPENFQCTLSAESYDFCHLVFEHVMYFQPITQVTSGDN